MTAEPTVEQRYIALLFESWESVLQNVNKKTFTMDGWQSMVRDCALMEKMATVASKIHANESYKQQIVTGDGHKEPLFGGICYCIRCCGPDVKVVDEKLVDYRAEYASLSEKHPAYAAHIDAYHVARKIAESKRAADDVVRTFTWRKQRLADLKESIAAEEKRIAEEAPVVQSKKRAYKEIREANGRAVTPEVTAEQK